MTQDLRERLKLEIRNSMLCWGACTPDQPLRCNCEVAADAALTVALEEAARALDAYDERIASDIVRSLIPKA